MRAGEAVPTPQPRLVQRVGLGAIHSGGRLDHPPQASSPPDPGIKRLRSSQGASGSGCYSGPTRIHLPRRRTRADPPTRSRCCRSRSDRRQFQASRAASHQRARIRACCSGTSSRIRCAVTYTPKAAANAFDALPSSACQPSLSTVAIPDGYEYPRTQHVFIPWWYSRPRPIKAQPPRVRSGRFSTTNERVSKSTERAARITLGWKPPHLTHTVQVSAGRPTRCPAADPPRAGSHRRHRHTSPSRRHRSGPLAVLRPSIQAGLPVLGLHHRHRNLAQPNHLPSSVPGITPIDSAGYGDLH